MANVVDPNVAPAVTESVPNNGTTPPPPNGAADNAATASVANNASNINGANAEANPNAANDQAGVDGAAGAAAGGSGIFSNGDFIKGALIGAAATYILTNESAQKAIFKGFAKFSQLFESGLEELKERFEDARAEAQDGINDL